MYLVVFWFICGHLRELQFFHQAVHSANADVNAIITLQKVSNLIGTKTLVVIRINVQDQGSDVLVFTRARCRLGTEVLVIGTSVYL